MLFTFATALPALGTPIKWVGENIDTLSNGKVKMKVCKSSKLVAPFEILDAVSTCKANAGCTTVALWSAIVTWLSSVAYR